jgi:hypothetical protein
MLTTVRAIAFAVFDAMTAPMATMMLLAILQMVLQTGNQRVTVLREALHR